MSHDLYEHSDWSQSLGQVGVVLKVLQGTGDVRVAIGGRKWTMNPRCVVPAPDETPPLIIDGTFACRILTINADTIIY